LKVALLTPGAGGFYCGTCLRDNALARGLHKIGVDVITVPLYLPALLDEPQAPHAPLFLNGIRVGLHQMGLSWLVKPLGGLLSRPSMLRLAARASTMTRASVLGETTVSMLRGETGRQAPEVGALADWLSEQRPDVVCLSNVLLLGLARSVLEATDAAVVCVMQGEEAFLRLLPEPYNTEVWALLTERAQEVSAFAAFSRYHGERMVQRLGIDPERLSVVPTGLDLEGYDALEGSASDPPVVGYLARLCEDKGLFRIVDSFLRLKQRDELRDLRLHVAGTAVSPDRDTIAALKAWLARSPYAGDVSVRVDLERDEKVSFYEGLSVFSVPAEPWESSGRSVYEALAAGVPVVQPRHGAFVELVEDTGGGVLYDPSVPESLDSALAAVLGAERERAEMAQRGRDAVRQRHTAAQMATSIARVCERAARRRGEAP
jgi:glycosyltransferase involved in cell wall biosynthesis